MAKEAVLSGAEVTPNSSTCGTLDGSGVGLEEGKDEHSAMMEYRHNSQRRTRRNPCLQTCVHDTRGSASDDNGRDLASRFESETHNAAR